MTRLDRGVLTGLADLRPGVTVPVGVPASIRASDGGVGQHRGGNGLRAFEDTNTSRQEHHGGAARPGVVKSRVGHSATQPRHEPNAPGPRPVGPVLRTSAARAAAFFAFLKSRTFCSDAASTTSATER